MDMGQELGIKSYCFREFKDNRTVVKMLKECGVDRLDISGTHFNIHSPDSWDEVFETYRSGGIALIGMTAGLTDDPAHNRRIFQFAQRAGFTVISSTFAPKGHVERIKQISALCDEFGCRLAIHNHGGHDWLGCAQTLEYLFDIAGPQIGLCMDTAWTLDAGENPSDWIDRFGERLYAIHYKDFVFERCGKEVDVVVGTGCLNLPDLLTKLRALNFSGPAVIEYEGDADQPVPALTKCVKAVRQSWKGLPAVR
jgi:sugar phosphate isomerase/epimerase